MKIAILISALYKYYYYYYYYYYYCTKSDHHLQTKILVFHSSQVVGLSLPNNIIEQLQLTIDASLSKIKPENLRPIQLVIISTICIFYQLSFLIIMSYL